MKKGAKVLEGKHDFSAYRAASCSAKSPIKKINSIKIKRDGDEIAILISSNHFYKIK